jgi:hypothetical protein
MLIGINM